jgi:hypothetical protein
MPKGQPEAVFRRRTNNTMTKKKRKGKRTNNDIQNIEQKTIYIEQDEAH